MAAQRLISTHFPYVPITLSIHDHSEDVEALLDTGFTGFVIVPAGFVSDLASPDARLQYALADGSVVTAPAFRGAVKIGPFGPFRTVISVLGDEPIVGRALMDQFTITLEHGTRVVVDP
jgi:predicted aspartyl protease